jgi:hypothetical protein
MPKPGTISLPLGVLDATGASFFSAELETDEVVVELADVAPVADVIVVSFTSADGVAAVAVMSCTVTDSAMGAVFIC